MEKRILILGCGMVAKPCVDYLLRDEQNTLIIGCRTLSSAEKVADNRPRVTPISLDITSAALDSYIEAHDVVITLVPSVYHAYIFRSAIRGRTHMVTTCNTTPGIRDAEPAAKAAGVTILNGFGVSPGIDHLYAIKTIREIRSQGGRISEFTSFCGGLPAPDASDNPLRFKFSWSPSCNLLSQFEQATFLQHGKVHRVSELDLMLSARPYKTTGYTFHAYPNGDSMPLRDAYGLYEAETFIRGTLRYEGNPSLIKTLVDLGWLCPEAKKWLGRGWTLAQIQERITMAASPSEADLVARMDQLFKYTSPEGRDRIISGLRWIGLFCNETPALHRNLLDNLIAQLVRRCSFQPGERDLVMLQQTFMVQWRDGSENTIKSTLELFGDPQGYSAMAKGVGITCGIATQMLLDGLTPLQKPGIILPYTEEICRPLRAKLEAEGIKFLEEIDC